MRPEFFQRGPKAPTRALLRRPGVTIGPTQVREEHMKKVREARRVLGLDEGFTTIAEENES